MAPRKLVNAANFSRSQCARIYAALQLWHHLVRPGIVSGSELIPSDVDASLRLSAEEQEELGLYFIHGMYDMRRKRDR